MSAVPDPPRRADVLALREGLERAGFRIDRLRGLVGSDGVLSGSPVDADVYLRRLPIDDRLGDVARLFVFGRRVPVAGARRALGGPALRALLRSGLLEDEGGAIRATVQLVPHGALLIASDQHGTGADVVTGINGPASLLAGLAIRRPVTRTLDLGAGNGIQALLASRHSEVVVSTDVNPRALAYTRLNAALNLVTNIETRLGSWFDPVAGETFDLILSNPPYVISPDSELIYRDSGMLLDELCRRLAGDAPGHLVEGGIAQMLVSWAVPQAGAWEAPVRAWFQDGGADALVMYFSTDDPVIHAAKWNRPLRDRPGAHAAAMDRWVGHLQEHGVVGVAYGSIALRRRAGPGHWVRTEALRPGGPESGAHVLRMFANQDLLEGLPSPEALLRLVPVLPAGLTVEQSFTWRKGEMEVLKSELSMSAGLAYRGTIDVSVVRLLQCVDGNRTAGEAIESAAGLLDLDPADRTAFRLMAADALRRFLELGILEAGPDSG